MWQPIETAPEFRAVLYFLPHSVTGYFDTCEVAMKISNPDDVSYWTSLGPNSGDDITDWIEQATHWMPLPAFPPESHNATPIQHETATLAENSNETDS